ncbi:MAG: T9SS type A sorting domain-containing protein [Bacteroidetes bacterium]|nr:T9SS type A sorting domain-containing protein [Bacteroidota bacterium]
MKQTLLFVFLFLSFAYSATAQSGPTEMFPVEDPAESLSIFPNPAVDFIELSGPIGRVKSIVIYSMVGRAVRQYPVRSGVRYEVGDLPNGMYLVQMLDSSRKVVQTDRMHKRS